MSLQVQEKCEAYIIYMHSVLTFVKAKYTYRKMSAFLFLRATYVAIRPSLEVSPS